MRRSRASVVALLALAPTLLSVAPPFGASAAPSRSAAQVQTAAPPDTYTVTGRVVRVSNGRPVRGVRVSATNANETGFIGSDLTDAEGRFVMRGVTADDNEFGIYVQGARVGFENGWVGCDRTLKPTFGDACTLSSPTGKIRIKKS